MKKLYVLVISALIGATAAAATYGPASSAGQKVAANSAKSDMAIFRDDAGANQGAPPVALPTAVADAVGDLPAPAQGIGLGNEAKHVLVTVAVGSPAISRDLYLFPTSAGSVCIISNDGAHAGTCVDNFDASTPAGWIAYHGLGLPMSVVGVAPDGVSAVDVSFGSQVVHAGLVSGVFAAAVASDRASSVVVALHYGDGRTVTQGLPDTSSLSH
jgi:hypothetical protein